MSCFFLYADQLEVALILPLLRIQHGTNIPKHSIPSTIIFWGYSPAIKVSANSRIMNPPISIKQSADKKDMQAFLKTNGLNVADVGVTETAMRNQGKFSVEYKISLFHLNTLAVSIKKRQQPIGALASLNINVIDQFTEIDPFEKHGFYLRKAMRVAVKAAYALGLDIATVHIGINTTGQTIVLNVTAIPQLDNRLAEIYANAINRYAESIQANRFVLAKRERLILGADPEFLLRNANGKIVFADKFMDREGIVGCDSVILSGHRVILPLVELRPQPSESPRILLDHLRQAMLLASEMIADPNLEWLAGGMPVNGFPLGGHIHFSGVELSCQLLRALDNYLALPLILLEAKTTGRRRPRYGFLGDFRRQPHGGFEYRSLPSWLVSPQIAVGVLALSLVIAKHYERLTKQPLLQLDIQRAYYQGNKLRIFPLLSELWADISATETYFSYRKELEHVYGMMRRMEMWQEQQDFRTYWHITTTSDKTETSAHFMV